MKPKLAYLSDAMIPSRKASSIQVMKTSEMLSKCGVDTTLIIPKNSNGKSEVYSYYNTKTKFNVKRISFQPLERYQFSILSGYAANKINPDVIYGRFIPSCFFAALFGNEVVIESHSPAPSSGKIINNMFSALVKSGKIRDLIVITESLADYYIENFSINRENVHVIPDSASDPFPIESRISTKSFSVGYTGSLYKGKGISIIAELSERYSDIEFHIIGGEDSDINHWMEKLNDRENVYFHGFVPPAEVPAYQNSFDVLIAPYKRTVYGSSQVTDLSDWMSPLKLFEYMAVQKPILTSDIPVIREVMEDEVNCLLCDPDNIEDWSESLNRLRTNSELREELGAAAREKFKTNHTYEERAKKIIRSLEI